MIAMQQALFEYLIEKPSWQLLPAACYRSSLHNKREQWEAALLAAMTEPQRALFEAYQNAVDAVCDLEQQAMFLATWAAARELL